MRNQKNERGITLVALVVTIVVLLILAGITIMYVMSDNGVFGQARRAGSETDKAAVQEAVMMAVGDLYAEVYAPSKNEDGSDKTLAEVFAADLPNDMKLTTPGTVESTDGTANGLKITGAVIEYKNFSYTITYTSAGLTVGNPTPVSGD